MYTASKDIRHSSYEFGLQAEKVVCEWYEKRGFKIIHKRYKTPFGEVDLIARRNNLLIFIEVKARYKQSDYELITKRQIKRNSKAALSFLGRYESYNGFDMRFDLAVVIGNQISEIIESAWDA